LEYWIGLRYCSLKSIHIPNILFFGSNGVQIVLVSIKIWGGYLCPHLKGARWMFFGSNGVEIIVLLSIKIWENQIFIETNKDRKN